MIEINTSIDRLSIMGYDTDIIEGYIKNSNYMYYHGFSKNYAFRHAYKGLNGEFFEMGDKKKLRIDFNPNTANMEEIKKILSWIKHPYLTRIDIAIDYFNIDLSDINWMSSRPRKQNIWRGLDGKLETLYLGSASSEKRYRIYNKRLERLEKKKECSDQEHWRVEVQQRFKENDNLDTHEYLAENLYDIKPYTNELDLSQIKSPKERIMIRGILEKPSELNYLNPKTKTKYRQLIKEIINKSKNTINIEEPIEIYKKEREHLTNQLNDILNMCSSSVIL
ncbi:hypothetical protein ACQCV6_30765 [Bacillus cereus]|uniref:hypothetical protein n=1 Tax=Bacillus cereus TaxID=1396 RepID=UPI003CEB5BB1|nr:hypothetical protein [Bacillus cereus]